MTRMEYGGMLRLDALLARAAVSAPHRDAVICQNQTWSYAEVHNRARRLAGALAALGVQKGTRVAYWAGNRAEFVEMLFGVSMVGAIASPLDHWWTWSDAEVALAQIRPTVFIVGGPQAAQAAGHRDALEAAGVERVLCLDDCPAEPIFDSYAHSLASATRLRTPTPVVGTDPAVIFFTSGSTGRSKGAVHTHGSLVATARTQSMELGLRDGERSLHCLPLFASCLEQLIPLTLMGATHIILPQFDASAAWDAVLKHGVTHSNAVPTTLRRLLDAAPGRIPPLLRSVSYASERMPEPLITALVERMPAVGFVQFYGMIEQLCLTVSGAADQLRKIATVGRPMLGAEMYLQSEDGEPAGVGESGEIIARSPSLFAGYWEDEAATARVMLGGWMRTGDVGRFDDDGFLVLEGRLKDMIKSGGITVIPAEVEHVLMGHPQVSEAVVLGMADENWGEAVHAFVTVAPGALVGEADLKAFCHERLAGYKRPKVIHIVPELPRTGIGKVARRAVRDRALASRAQ